MSVYTVNMDLEECLSTKTTIMTTAGATTNAICHRFESSESGSDSPMGPRESHGSLSAEATASDSGINVADDNESTCNLRKRLLRNETFINLINILKRVHDIDVRLIEIEFIADDKEEEATKSALMSDALRAEKIVKRQLERVRLEAEKRNLLTQMDSIKTNYYCQLGSFSLLQPTRQGMRQDFSPLSRKVSSESDRLTNSELDDFFDDPKSDGRSHNVMEWAFHAKERLQDGRLSALSPWDTEEFFPKATSNGRSPLFEDNGNEVSTRLESRVWKISSHDEEELRKDPFEAVAPQMDVKCLHHRTVGKEPSADSISNDAEMNRMVARVLNDPNQDTDQTDPTLAKNEQLKLSFDAECEMIKTLLKKSQVPSLDDEYVGSVATLHPRESPVPTPPPPGFSADTSAPIAASDPTSQTASHFLSALDGRSPTECIGDNGDTMIVLPDGESTFTGSSTPEASQCSRGLAAMTTSPIQLFAGAPLFALPALPSMSIHGISFYDEFRQNGHEVPSTPSWGVSNSMETIFNSQENHASGTNVKKDCDKPFSWASMAKSGVQGTQGAKGDSSANVDVVAEQRLCRILETFIQVLGCSYEEARSLLERMQAKYDFMPSTPMDMIVTAARDLLKTDAERKKGVPLTQLSAQTATTTSTLPSSNKEEELPWNYKTVMCNFHKDGMCRLGEKCMFAHSKAELREPYIPNGFCIAFVTKGVCKWGSSCNYIHEIPAIAKKQHQISEKSKVIKGADGTSAQPRVPVGLNFVTTSPALKSGALAPVSTPSKAVLTTAVTASTAATAAVASSSKAQSSTMETVKTEGITSSGPAKTKNKSKKDKDKEDEEWSKVSRGAKPVRAPELRSPAAIVAAFQLDNQCILCRDQVSASNNRITLECGHSQFHRGCIKDWLKSQTPATCPVCKSVSNLETEEALAEATSKKKK